jgi:non-specific serine/threonine protein kinase/serine/threonine-protein kinase
LDAPQFRRLVDLVGEAMLLPAHERPGLVARACAGDPALLAEARSLLAEAEATSFETVTARIGAGVARAADTLPVSPRPLPARIGPYRILGVLGEGGMGLVYRAEQTAPIHREVALKMVRGGLRDERARARFEAERQALAVMSHPGIASIYDAGATDEGVPYFAMELVRGEPITAFCDAHRLDLEARGDLFAEVCRAVQHAHLHGVIHRDLKPANILVSMVDGHPRPRIIDFGIAKAAEATADTETMHTAIGSVIGTLEYMSPEQAAGGAAPMDTRSDVYSLGVILYELVTGALPFDSGALRRAGPLDAQRLIRDTDPPTPARRFVTSTERAAIARARSTDPRALQRRLGGDLGWIVMKALEKEPARRYQSANDLADDLDRLRRSEPVEAGPPSRRYRTARFVRRHRTVVTAATVVFVALLVGITLATVESVRARSAQHRAEEEARRATMIKDFLTQMLAQARPENSRGRAVTVMEVVDSVAAQIDRNQVFPDDPVVQAAVVHAIGETYRTLDRYDRAIPLFRRAIALERSALGADDSMTVTSLNKLAESQTQTGDVRGAIETQKEVVAATEKSFGRKNYEYCARLGNLGNMYADVGDLAAAERVMREALGILRGIPQTSKDALPTLINNLATVLVDEGKCDDALPLHEESLALRRRIYGEPSAEVAVALGNYGKALNCSGRQAEADPVARRALAMCETVFGPNHNRTATAKVRLGEVCLRTGRAREAEPLLREAIATFAAINPRFWRVGDARARLGEALLAEGRKRDGIAELETGWEIFTATTAPGAPRSREIATLIASYYDSEKDLTAADRWRQRAFGGSVK